MVDWDACDIAVDEMGRKTILTLVSTSMVAGSAYLLLNHLWIGVAAVSCQLLGIWFVLEYRKALRIRTLREQTGGMCG